MVDTTKNMALEDRVLTIKEFRFKKVIIRDNKHSKHTLELTTIEIKDSSKGSKAEKGPITFSPKISTAGTSSHAVIIDKTTNREILIPDFICWEKVFIDNFLLLVIVAVFKLKIPFDQRSESGF